MGNIFKLGTKYSIPFDLKFRDKDGTEKPVIMGCYGIGISRLLGVLAEYAQNDHLVWPKGFAPYDISIVLLDYSPEAYTIAAQITSEVNLDVLIDRRNIDLGQKLRDAEVAGIPIRVVLGASELSKKMLLVKWGQKQSAQVEFGKGMCDELLKIFTVAHT